MSQSVIDVTAIISFKWRHAFMPAFPIMSDHCENLLDQFFVWPDTLEKFKIVIIVSA